MRSLDPRILLPVAAVLLLTGFLLPLGMIMHMIPSTFFLNFFAYGASTLGTMLGFIGAASIAVRRRRK